MSVLVPIPWQPTLVLTPSTLSYLVAASDRLGRHLFLVGSDAAYRTFARQDFLYQGFLKKLAGVPGYEGFNTASSPNPPGQRSHMRGAAFDLIDTSAAVQAACRAVGLVRDAVETWHWNDPHWASMPIILTNTATAGGGGTTTLPTLTPNKQSIPSHEENSMRIVKPLEDSSVVYTLGELTYQKLDTLTQGSMSAHIWNGLDGKGEPVVVSQAWIDNEIGEIEKRRAQFAQALKALNG